MIDGKTDNTVWVLIFAAGIIVILWLLHTVRKRNRRRERQKMQLQRGMEGEQDTVRYLEQVRGRKKILSNVYIPKNPEKEASDTTEIDLIVVHQKGILVVENKNYSGLIYGDDRDRNWMQVCGRHDSRLFYSPVLQNSSHIRYLKRFLEFKLDATLPYFSVITFNSSARLKKISLGTKEMIVCNSGQVKQRLNRALLFRRTVLDRRQMEEISRILEAQTHVSRRTKREHIRNTARFQGQG